MKVSIGFLAIILVAASCHVKTNSTEESNKTALPIEGTWKLISGTVIEKGDTTVTDYTKDLSFIKIINDSHLAFLSHDVNAPDSSKSFDAGGGKYSLKDSSYTEHLEYCKEREWEGHDFTFTVSIKNDTLIQSGIEKVDNAGINRLNIEKYVRLKD
jgi:hypothetical protein